jgi:hypothetical protein
VSASRLPEAENLYVRTVLRAYLDLPVTLDRARTADRVLARTLFAQAVPLDLVRAALVLACARRAARPSDASPLGSVRSLHYFLPVLEELRLSPPDPAYLAHLRARRSAPLTRMP